MIIKKIFNNNAVVAKDSANREVVAMGCGIAFKMSVGEILDQSKVEKTFILKEKEASERFKLLLEDVEPDVVSLCYDIIEYAKNILNGSLNDYIYVTLTDHIYNVLKLSTNKYNVLKFSKFNILHLLCISAFEAEVHRISYCSPSKKKFFFLSWNTFFLMMQRKWK